MGTSIGLFSHARPSNSNTKKPRGFLSLPGELRNQIYAYYFESDIRCEVVAPGRHFTVRKPRIVKLWAGAFPHNGQVLKHTSKTQDDVPIIIRMSRRLGKYSVVQGLQTNWLGSLYAINLVCKLLHTETVSFLYRNTVFVFDAPKRMTNFLAVVSKARLECIVKLQLHYATYGCPKFAKDRTWQEKHHESWIRACKMAARRMGGLRELRIWIRVNHEALRFDLREVWVLPLLQFRRLERANSPGDGKKLERVEIDFRTPLSGNSFRGNQRLAHASEDLHRLFGESVAKAIMGAKEEEAMAGFKKAWEGKHAVWQYHLGFGKTGW